MFSNAYDHGVVAALDELEKVAGKPFAKTVSKAVRKAKGFVEGAKKSVGKGVDAFHPRADKDPSLGKSIGDFYRPSAIAAKRQRAMGLVDKAKTSINYRGARDELNTGARNSAIRRGAATAGGVGAVGGGTAYALSGDNKGRTKKAGIRESLSNMGGHIGDGASSAWGGIKRGAGAVQDFYSPEAIQSKLRSEMGLIDRVRSRFGSGAEDLASEAKRAAILRGLITAGGLGAAGGGAAYGMSGDDEDGFDG